MLAIKAVPRSFCDQAIVKKWEIDRNLDGNSDLLCPHCVFCDKWSALQQIALPCSKGSISKTAVCDHSYAL